LIAAAFQGGSCAAMRVVARQSSAPTISLGVLMTVSSRGSWLVARDSWLVKGRSLVFD
jgi:hypothetical protein